MKYRQVVVLPTVHSMVVIAHRPRLNQYHSVTAKNVVATQEDDQVCFSSIELQHCAPLAVDTGDVLRRNGA